MALPKYQQKYQEMIELHQDIFDELKKTNPKSPDFKDIQFKAVRLVRKYESALCGKTEATKFSNFSTGLAEKFMELVRKDYPEIDQSS